MSIFQEPIRDEIKKSLGIRQDIMGRDIRTPKELAFLNSNTSWISLKSSVDVNNDGGKLAKENVLLGGALSNNNLKFGVSNDIIGAYSNKNQTGDNNILGIRPMPGITSLSIRNLGAYGSTRKAIVEFQCWDVKQLDILEQLYMRPGFLVLLEFGRSTYLQKDKSDDKKYNLIQTDRILSDIDKEDFFQKRNIQLIDELNKNFQKSVKTEGNYDAFLGYVSNYGWELRPDGGYNCKTEIISTGEVLQSLKTNYSLSNLINFKQADKNEFPFKGLLLPNIVLDELNDTEKEKIESILLNNLYIDEIKLINESYTEHILLGLLIELRFIVASLLKNYNSFKLLVNGKKIDIKTGHAKYRSDSVQYQSRKSKVITIVDKGYITLESFVELINTFIIPVSYADNKEERIHGGSIARLSTKKQEFLGKGNENLKCLFNELMTSINPDICIIKNPNWIKLISKKKFYQESPNLPKIPTSDPLLNNAANIRLRNRIAGYLIDLANNKFGSTDIKPTILENITSDWRRWKNTNQEGDFFIYFQKNYQLVRGSIEKSQLYTDAYVKELQAANEKSLTDEAIYNALQYKRTWDFIPDPTIRKKLNKLYGNQNYNNFYKLLKSEANYENFLDYAESFLGGSFPQSEWGRVLSKAKSGDNKFTLESLEKSNLDTNIDSYINNNAKQQENFINDKKQIEELYGDIKEISTKYDTFLNTFTENFIDESGKLGIIGNIYLNIKHLIYVSDLLLESPQNPLENKTISIYDYFDQILRDIKQSTGEVNNFEISIDDKDGIGRIIDRVITNPELVPDFKFNLGNKNTIIRDLKLESKIFSEQTTMIAMAAQSNPGVLGLENSSLIAYNKGLKNRLMPNIESLPILTSNIPSSSQVENSLSSLSKIFKDFFKPWIGGSLNTVEGNDTGQYQSEKYPFLSNQLRDVISVSTQYQNAPNKQTMIIPTETSFTIDGISGLIIGNTFAFEDTFVPYSYKSSSGKTLNYTIIGLDQSIQNNDWTTSVRAYPYILRNVEDQIPSVDVSDVIISYNANSISPVETPLIDTLTPGNSFYDKVRKINKNYVISADKKVSKTFEPLIIQILEKINQTNKNISIVIISAQSDRGGTSKHNTGNAIDFQIAGISSNTTNYDSRIKTFAPTPITSLEYKLSQWYSEDQMRRIDEVDKIIKSFAPLVPKYSSYNISVNGTLLTYLNEYYYPSVQATGPHFHIQTTV